MQIFKTLRIFQGKKWLQAKLGRKLTATRWREFNLNLASGGKLYAHLHHPHGNGPFPGLVIVPGGGSPGTDYDKGWRLRAEEIASAGFAVLHYDPSGRGASSGQEDHWGHTHQDELAEVIVQTQALPEVDSAAFGLASFSIGICTACGCLARHPELKVDYLFDWEGPSNRHNATRNDTHPPLASFPTKNDVFWSAREAVANIGKIRCGYYRYQARIDHVQGDYQAHALELVQAARNGEAAWIRLNGIDPAGGQTVSFIEPGQDHRAKVLEHLIMAQSLAESLRQAHA